MKNIFILCIVLIVSVSSYSQVSNKYKKSIKWQELESTKRYGTPKILGNNSDNLFIISDIKNKHFLDKYDVNSLKKKLSNEVVYRFMKKTTPIVDAFMVGEVPVVLTSFYNKKKRINYLFYSKVNTKNLTMSNPKVLLYGKVKKGQRSSLESFEFVDVSKLISADKKQSAFCYPNPKKERSSKRYYNKYYKASVFNSDFEFKHEIDFEIPFEKFEVKQIELGNNGVIYMVVDELVLAKDPNSKRKNKTKLFIKDRHICFIDSETGELEKMKLELEDGFMGEFLMKPLKNGGLVLSGLTKHKNKKGAKGSFKITLDKNLVEVSNNTIEFEDEFLKKTWTNRTKAKVKKTNKKRSKKGKQKIIPQFYNYYVNQIVELSDGSTTMLAEQYYVRVVTTTTTNSKGQTTTKTTYYYYYNDIVVVNYSSTGDFNWKKVIKKKQHSTNDFGFYLSYFLLENDDDGIDIIYNERNIAVKVSIDSDGETNKNNIIEFEDRKMRLVPKMCTQTEEGVFLYAKSKRKSKIGLLKL